MIPIRDSSPRRGIAYVTKGLILLNAIVFLWELTQSRQLGHAFISYAIVPARYMHPAAAAEYFGPFPGWGAALLPFLTSMFLHGGWVHLLGNMWVLWIFGDGVEARLVHGRYLLLYLASGLFSASFHILTNPNSGLPTIGASGAIAGVMGAYFRFFPFARVEALIPPFFFGPTFVLPAVVFLGWWFLLPFFNGALSLGARGGFGGVAWWAHVGGFLFGLIVCWPMPRRRVPPRIIDV